MSIDHREQYLDRFHSTLRQVIEPLYSVIDAPIQGAQTLLQWRQTTDQRISVQRDLEDTIRQQQAILMTHDYLKRENAQLRALLELTTPLAMDFVTSRVLSVDLNPFAHRLVIDQGANAQLSPGLATVDELGLIGQIDSVTPSTARVILITDPDHALPVRVVRTGEVTLAYGGGLDADLRLTDLPMNTSLVIGDVVETSGLGGVFPAGLPVAVVSAIERPDGQTFAHARATPIANLERSAFVVVLRPDEAKPVKAVEESNGG